MNQKYTEIIIVRHGQTNSNLNIQEDTSTTKLGSHLTETGIQQADNLGKKLKDLPISAIYSSDLVRASETAKIIAMQRNLQVIIDPLLRERVFTNQQGDARKMAEESLGRIIYIDNSMSEDEKLDYRLTSEMETGREVLNRVVPYLKNITKENFGKTIMVVTHGNVLRLLLIFMKYGRHSELPTGSVANTGYIVVKSDGESFSIIKTVGIKKDRTV